VKANYFLAKAMRYWIRKYPSPSLQKFVRDHFRKWCPADEILTGTQEGFNIFASPRNYASYGIYFLGEYDRHMTNFMKAHIIEGNTCWDIGTDRGWFTLLMASLVGSEGRVDAFEAFPGNFRKLEKNIGLNSFSWVHANNLAVSDKTGKMHFLPPSDKITNYIGYLNDCSGVGYLTTEKQPGSISVSTVTLDQYADEAEIRRLDFVKLDIEGAEVAALQGAERTIKRFRPTIAVEYNRETALRAGTSINELDILLENFEYDRFTFWNKLRKLKLEEYKDRPDNEVVFNVYCFPRT